MPDRSAESGQFPSLRPDQERPAEKKEQQMPTAPVSCSSA
ncbi:hypothetical protein B0G38_000841 [Arthrobacter sp. VKM Ac-2550]|nr:hypothetical protein [Arthrobacter sp. VKM Ac-2550]